jgi:hypothetical protein
MPRSRAHRPSVRPELRAQSPCLPSSHSRYPCPSRVGAVDCGSPAGGLDGPGDLPRSPGRTHWLGRAPLDSPAGDTSDHSRLGRDHKSGRCKRSRRTTRTAPGEDSLARALRASSIFRPTSSHPQPPRLPGRSPQLRPRARRGRSSSDFGGQIESDLRGQRGSDLRGQKRSETRGHEQMLNQISIRLTQEACSGVWTKRSDVRARG